MDNLAALGLLALGFVLLVAGAETMVRYASRLGLHYGLKPMMIGATIVAFGTSAPEFVVSFLAAIDGRPDMALGNAVGSNITNIGLVLGLTAAIAPIPVMRQIIKAEYVSALAATALVVLVAWDGAIDRLDGFVLILAFTVFFVFYTHQAIVKRSKKGEETVEVLTGHRLGKPWISWILTILGIALLLLGADMVVAGASAIALNMGMSEAAVAATIVALGTSLPEVAASVVAALKREHELAVGNVLGSNLFNMLFVLGPSAIIVPIRVQGELVYAHLAIMLGITILLFPFLVSGKTIGLRSGLTFLTVYVAFFLLNAGVELGWVQLPLW